METEQTKQEIEPQKHIEEIEDDEEKKEEGEADFKCTPYEFSNTSGKEIDYNKLIAQFGTRPLTNELLERMEKLIGQKPHIYLRRGKLFS